MVSPTLRQIEYLLAIDETGSFSAAAERCFATQSTISAGIKEMENLLGQEVIERSAGRGGSVRLSSFGQIIIDHCRAVAIELENISNRAQEWSAPMSAPIRMGVIPTIAPYWLPDMMPLVRKAYPDLDLQIFEGMSQNLYEQLMEGMLDVLILALPYETPGCVQYPLFEEAFYLASPKGADIAQAPYVHLDSLDADELLLLEDGHCLTDHALQACALQRSSGKRSYSASSLTTLIQMVAHGYGQTLLPEMVVMRGHIPDTIAVSRFDDHAPTRMVGAVWRDHCSRKRDIELLLDVFTGGGPIDV